MIPQHDIYIRALDGPGRLGISLEYWSDRITMTKGKQVAGSLGVALSAIIESHEQDIGTLTC
jgi:hypothetical protein